MKSKTILIVVFLFLGSLSLVFLRKVEETKLGDGEKVTYSKSSQTTNSWLEKFYIGAVHDGIDCKYNYANLDSLGFNIWHRYSLGNHIINGKPYPAMNWAWGNSGYCGDISNDSLFTPVESYAYSVKQKINGVLNADSNIRIITMRPKIEYLCYGQRSDYQCEPIGDTSDLWFYAFNDHETGDPITDYEYGEGAKVIHCRAGIDDTGFVVKRLKANTEQCNRIEIPAGNEWQGDSYCDWIIKPRIRIDSNFAHNNQNSPVCRIKIIGENGTNVLREVIIKAKNFIKNGEYNGTYIEEYDFSGDTTNLILSGDWGSNHGYHSRGTCDTNFENSQSDTDMNKADIKVYWYGNCDMWIDYVRVDNDVASDLLSTDTSNVVHMRYEKWIQDEIQQIALQTPSTTGEPMIMKYYLETSEFNNIPCIGYVNAKIKQYSNGKIDIIQDLTNTISTHVPWKRDNHNDRVTVENAGFLYRQYIQKTGYTQVFMETYPLTGCYNSTQVFSKIPNSLDPPNYDSILAIVTTPAEYEIYLQDNVNHKPYVLEREYDNYEDDPRCDKVNGYELPQDRGNFRYKLQLGDSLSKLANIPFILMAQAHQWYRQGEVRREATNEELNMMINTSLCYGVKGIMYFAYNSAEMENGSYGIGIADNSGNLRRQNLYGQTNPNKLQTLQGITERVANKWSYYLLKFDNTNRETAIIDFETERLNFFVNTYFNGIISFKYGSGIPPCNEDLTPPAGTTFDCPDERYIQAAVFKDNEPCSEYFMLVNRRCSPVNTQSTNDGKRWIYILLDQNSQDFQYFNNWSITDLLSDSIIVTFNKNANTYLDLGWFMPGEGKLYKIAPVMQEGGTLVCDENVTTSITCKGEVIAEDKVINIGNQLTISFTSNGGFNFSGGEFHSGNPAQSGTPGPVFTSVSGQKWNGIKLTDGIKSYISKSTFNNIKQNENAIEFYDCVDARVENSNFTCPQEENSGLLMLNFSLN